MNSIRSSYIYYTIFFLISALFLSKEAESSSVAGQETLIGIVGRDFIILGADSSVSSSISLTSSNVDKIRIIVDPFPHGKGYGLVQGQGRGHGRGRGQGIDDEQQQIIAVASAGDAADSERLLGHLAFHTSSMEYQYLGCDVKCIYHGDHFKGSSNSLTAAPSSWLSSPAGLDAESVAFLARGLIASSLRSRGQLKTCLLVAGMVRRYQNPDDYEHVGLDSANASETAGRCLAGVGEELEYYCNSDSPSFAQRIQHQVRAARSSYSSNKVQNLIHSSPCGGDNNHRRDNSLIHGEGENNTDDTKSTILKPQLFWLDEYGSLQSVEYGVHGLASNFALSILDRKYHPNLSREEAADLVADCFQQLRKRFVINSPELPCIKCIDSDGCNIIKVPPIQK